LLTNQINKATIRADMRMTAASEYGCLALLAIGQRAPEFCKTHDIVERFQIPAPFLQQILRKLIAAGFVVSRRGAEGGFRLGRPPGEIRIADVVRAMDGALAPTRSVSPNFYQPSPVEASPAFTQLFRQVRDAIATILEATTLEDILDHEHALARNQHRRRNGAGARVGARTAARRR
jgi:Rrf2 family cysteine metabolism transcriptional repressor